MFDFEILFSLNKTTQWQFFKQYQEIGNLKFLLLYQLLFDDHFFSVIEQETEGIESIEG